MAAVNQPGGGAGRWFGEGYVYVMREGNNFKIGYSGYPEIRLTQIRGQENNDNIELVKYFEAGEMNRAETAAQDAIKEKLELVKNRERGRATDWFVGNDNVTLEEICKVVEDAVMEHNNGYVYVMHAGGNYKIGCSKNPEESLREIQQEEKNDSIELVKHFRADVMNGAKTAAQEAVQKNLGVVKDPERGGATDWFVGNDNVTLKEICKVVEDAVMEHNEGYVYVMHAGGNYKIGCSKNPEESLREIQQQENNDNIELVNAVKATRMRRAEQLAQHDLGDQGFEKNLTDWFVPSVRVTPEQVWQVVEDAVLQHNDRG